jgi:hypothetical protein
VAAQLAVRGAGDARSELMKELVTSKQTARQAARLFASHSGFPAASRLGVVGHDLSKGCPDMRQRRLTVGGSRWTHPATKPEIGSTQLRGGLGCRS